MDKRDYIVLQKIDAHAESIINYCKGCETLVGFEENAMRVEATVFNLMQIGELAKTNLSDDAKEQIENIPWQQIYGMRNRIVHGYSGVKMQIVWDTISEDIPKLHQELQKILSSN